MAVAINARFVDNPNSADDGKIVVTIDTDYDPATVHTLAIVGPAGSIKTAGSPDATGADATIKVAMPTDIDGNYLPGSYAFTITIDPPPTGSAETYTATYTYAALTALRVMDINAYPDGITLQLVIEDNTAYPDGFTATRSITVQSPVIAGEADVATATQSTNPATVSLTRSSGNAYENVTYGIVYSATILSEEEDDEYTFQEQYLYEEQSTEVLIKVNRDPCDIISCVETYIREVMDEACNKGGISGLPKEKQDTLQAIAMYQSLYNWYSRIDCYDADKASYYYNLLKEIVEDCGCAPTTGARVIPSNGTTYIRGKSAYEIWLEEGNVGTEDDFFDSLNPIGDWITVDDADFSSDFTQLSSAPLKYRIEKAGIRFSGRVAPVSPGGFSSPIKVLESTFNPVTVNLNSRIPCWVSGNIVGSFYQESDGTWKILITSDVVLGNTLISGLLPTNPNIVAYTNAVWTAFENADYENNYVNNTDTFQWAVKNGHLCFKGSFDSDPLFLTSGGHSLIVDDYFTDRNITLEEGCKAPVFETAGNDDQAKCVGYIYVSGNDLWFAANPDGGGEVGVNKFSVAGEIRLA